MAVSIAQRLVRNLIRLAENPEATIAQRLTASQELKELLQAGVGSRAGERSGGKKKTGRAAADLLGSE